MSISADAPSAWQSPRCASTSSRSCETATHGSPPFRALDPRHPSTSFKVRGRDLRVDLLIPGRDGAAHVHLSHINAVAQPLAGLAYLLEETTHAPVIAPAGIFVRVPDPASFALHKLWVSTRRNASEAAKARKDHLQAAQILEVLVRDRPQDLGPAWKRLSKSMLPLVRRAARGIDEELRLAVGEQVQDAALSRR